MQLRYSLMVLGGGICYGFLSTITKFAYQAGFTGKEVTGSQALLGALFLWVVLFLIQRGRIQVTSRSAMQLLLAGTTMGSVWIFYYYALEELPASIAVVLLFQFTWIGVILEAIVERRFPSREKWLALTFIMVGTVLAANLTGASFHQLTIKGVIYGLISAVSYAFFIFFSGRVAIGVPSLLRSTLMVTGGALLVQIVNPPTYLLNGHFVNGLWSYSISIALIGAVLSTLLFVIGTPHIGGGLATILGSAEMPSVLIVSHLFLHETVTSMQWLGTLLILCAIALPELKQLWRSAAHFSVSR
ncbi:EamA family transporter [Rubeoparvulum massiliense]|uniref:EamA family transporter n=1 Tax=Rubeoparvulum massiliense TaxID=1631346 RepID=UPI00065E7C83|nr:DMT family transporter [Rubeoparvulum massiliense]